MELPRRVFISPLIEYVNFVNDSHINLIRLIKPYANGQSYAIYVAGKAESEICKNGMFKTIEKARAKFDLIVRAQQKQVKIRNRGITNN